MQRQIKFNIVCVRVLIKIVQPDRCLLGHLVYALGQVLDVLACHTSHGDATVLGQVHAVILYQAIDLLRCQSGETEHTNLIDNVLPVACGAQLLQVGLEVGAHIDDAIGHALDILKPLATQIGAVQNLGSNASTMNRGIRVEGTNENLDLRETACGLLFVGTDHTVGAGTFTIETHVLGKALRETEVVAIGLEDAHGLCIAIDIAGGKALVGHVEERIQFALLEDLRQLTPLLGAGIHSSGIVGAGVQQYNGSFGNFLRKKI